MPPPAGLPCYPPACGHGTGERCIRGFVQDRVGRENGESTVRNPRGRFRGITTLEFLEHRFSKMGHKNLLVTHKLHPAREASAVRLSSNALHRKHMSAQSFRSAVRRWCKTIFPGQGKSECPPGI
jgi:hypothetical protein